MILCPNPVAVERMDERELREEVRRVHAELNTWRKGKLSTTISITLLADARYTITFNVTPKDYIKAGMAIALSPVQELPDGVVIAYVWTQETQIHMVLANTKETNVVIDDTYAFAYLGTIVRGDPENSAGIS